MILPSWSLIDPSGSRMAMRLPKGRKPKAHRLRNGEGYSAARELDDMKRWKTSRFCFFGALSGHFLQRWARHWNGSATRDPAPSVLTAAMSFDRTTSSPHFLHFTKGTFPEAPTRTTSYPTRGELILSSRAAELGRRRQDAVG